MIRYKVIRHNVKYDGVIYPTGALLPENFTERDKENLVYSRRVTQIEISEDPISIQTQGTIINKAQNQSGTDVSPKTLTPTGTPHTYKK